VAEKGGREKKEREERKKGMAIFPEKKFWVKG